LKALVELFSSYNPAADGSYLVLSNVYLIPVPNASICVHQINMFSFSYSPLLLCNCLEVDHLEIILRLHPQVQPNKSFTVSLNSGAKFSSLMWPMPNARVASWIGWAPKFLQSVLKTANGASSTCNACRPSNNDGCNYYC
jgi:hypothetical protein